MNILHAAMTRYTTKSFDPQRTLDPAVLESLRALLRHSPSSVNSQPWHFILATSEEGRALVAKATSGKYAFNEPKVRHAAAVVVFCVRNDMDPAWMEALLAREDADGRFRIPDAKAGQNRGRESFVGLHRDERRDLRHWMEKQVYLSLGTLLLGAAAMEVDACPMEGFDAEILDRELGLAAKGYSSLVLVSLGHRSKDDFNAALPKSRMPEETVLTLL